MSRESSSNERNWLRWFVWVIEPILGGKSQIVYNPHSRFVETWNYPPELFISGKTYLTSIRHWIVHIKRIYYLIRNDFKENDSTCFKILKTNDFLDFLSFTRVLPGWKLPNQVPLVNPGKFLRFNSFQWMRFLILPIHFFGTYPRNFPRS